jgi:hypothetical protein
VARGVSWEWEGQVARGGEWSVGLVVVVEVEVEAEDSRRVGSGVRGRLASFEGGVEGD